MNKKCVALTEEQYKESISLIRSGFKLDGVSKRPNPRIAAFSRYLTAYDEQLY